MWRAVKIRKFFGIKRMRYQMIDSADNQMIRDPFHHFQSFIPAIRPKCLTHRISFFQRIQMGCRRSQFCKCIMIEFSIATSCIKGIVMIIHSRDNLSSDHVNSGIIHGLLPPEIVACAISKSCVGSIIFYRMSQIQHSMCMTPV